MVALTIAPHPHNHRWVLVIARAKGQALQATVVDKHYAPTLDEARTLYENERWLFRPYNTTTGRFEA